ncbi:MAG TPA: MDR family MFS transporter [Stellaceae bacterium]|nr:MDR family MFS transporter [Stellaceae bacterium]
MEQTVAQPTAPAVAAARRRLVLAASLMATFIAAVESTIVATAMPTIVADLGGFRLFSWVFTAYLLTMAVSVPVYGRLADLYGRKRVFFVGTGIFLIGTTLCGFAATMAALVLFRAVQGLGAGAIMPITSTIVGDIYTPAERARVQGYISSVFGISAIVGPALGAFIVENLHWRLVFWVNLPIGVASVLMYGMFLHERLQPREHRIDYLGSLLLALGVGAVMLALVQVRAFGGPLSAAVAAFGVAALVLLAAHERHAPEPIVPYRLWRNRVIALGNLGAFATFMASMGVSAFLPPYIQGVLGRSAGVAGFALGCQSVSWTLATFATAWVMIRTSYRASAIIGGVLLALSGVMLFLLQPTSGVLWAVAASLVMGFGIGFCSPVFVVSIQASVGWEERGAATGSNMFMRTLGSSWGAALFGAIVNFGLSRRPPGAGDAVNRLMEPALRRGLGAQQIARLTAAVAGALHEVYLVVALIAILTLALSLFYPAGLSPTRPAAHGREHRRAE